MKTKNIIGIFIALFAFVVFGSASNQPQKSVLWKISGNGLSKPSYLFGTHHLIPLSFLENVPKWKEAFAETHQVVGELDLSNLTELQSKLMASAMMPQGVTYESLYKAEDLQLIDTALKELLGAGIAQFKQMKPGMLSMIYTLTLYQKIYPFDGKGIDQFFQQEAVKESKPVVGLETAEDQIKALFESQSIERQAEFLLCMVKNPDYIKEQTETLHTAYLEQNLDKMESLYNEEPGNPCPSTQEEKDTINKNRNDRWVQKLPQIMQEKSSFIAVGCLHLVGKDGLIAQLRKAGYVVEAVK